MLTPKSLLKSWKKTWASQKVNQLIDPTPEFLDSVIENIPNMIFIKDAKELRFVRFNKAGEELLGYKREDLLGKNDYDFFPKEQADFFVEKDRAVLAGRKLVDISEEPIQTKFGTRILHTKKIPWMDSSGQPLYLLGVSEDITDKKNAEIERAQLLAEQLARVETEKMNERLKIFSDAGQVLNKSLDTTKTMEAFADVVIRANLADWCVIDLMDEDTGIIQTNAATRDPAYRELVLRWRERYPLDLDQKRGAGHVLRTGVPELYPEITLEMLRERLGASEDYELISKLGFRSSMVVPLQFGDRLLGAITFVSSHAGRTYGEIDLSIALELASRASFAIENARLYQKAQQANQAKTAFLANMSHEVRTPLAAVMGFAQIVSEDQSLPEEHRRNLGLITRNGQQLLRIVDEILDISKIESDRMDLEQIFFSLKDLVLDVMALLSVKAKEKNLELKTHFADSVPEGIRSDPTRLRQVLINIIGNAIKFTHHGRVELSLSAEPATSDGQVKISFKIADTGIGLNAEQAKSLFQPFTQADSSMTRKFGGTGLGLFLSRKLARMLGGDLILESSEPEQGSIFVFTLKARDVQLFMERSKMINPRAEQDSTEPAKEVGKGHVLVIDDSEDNRFLVSWYLKKIGFTCDMAESGDEGLKKIERARYGLVLLDIQMPGMDGFQVLNELKKKMRYPGPVVALTAHAMKGDRERCLDAGFDGYLTKPIEEKALRDSLESVISTHRP